MLQSVKRPSSTEILELSAKRVRRNQSVDTPLIVDAASEDVLRASRRKEEPATPAQDCTKKNLKPRKRNDSPSKI